MTKEEKKKYDKEYRKRNRNRILEYSKKHYQENIEYYKIYRQEHKEEAKQYQEKYRKEHLEERRIFQSAKRRTDSKLNLNHRISSLIRHSLKGNKNGWHWEDLVGYKLSDLIKRLKSTIQKGYCWNDILNGKLQIDHIVPIRAFVFETSKDKEFKQCWSLWNLRLLSAKENRTKEDSITNPILLNLLLKEVC